MPRGQKTPPETVYKIMASWAVTDNFRETSRETGIPLATVIDIVKKHEEEPEYVRLRAEKRTEFSNSASRVMKKALARLEKAIDDPENNIPANHLTTVIGTLYDKIALTDGRATENIAVEVKLPAGGEEYAG